MASLIAELERLGVRKGSATMVHASLRKLGPVENGAEGVLDALVAALGPAGTLLMPLGAPDDVPFDALTTPADATIGVLAEVFRRRADTKVGDHAAGRFAAVGARSAELVEPIPLHDYYGPGSPLARFTDAGGMVLRLGADPDTVTLTHYAEYLANVPNKRRVRRHYVRAEGVEQWIESLDDTDGIVDWPGGDYFSSLLNDFLALGSSRIGAVGNCRAELLEARAFIEFAVTWMEKNLQPSAR